LRHCVVGIFVSLVALAGCEAPSTNEAMDSTVAEDGSQEPIPENEPGVVVIKAEEYAFTAPSIFPSGWVWLRLDNQGAEPHFLLVWNLPDGKTFDDYAAEVAVPFQELYTRYRAGELDQAQFFEQLLAAIPDWFYQAVPMGGPGFTAPGQISETMIHLDPDDNYVLECYVRSMKQDDRFHGSEGMLRPLIVSEEATGLEPPEADIGITLSTFEIAVEGDLSAGPHIARVSVTDVPEGFVRHNVHLARLEADRTAEEVASWMNWVDAMVPPAPAEFIAGAGQTVAGRQSYLSFDLEPGRYAWVSELHGIQGMVYEFTVE
jgi:hypothetical protein